MQGLSFVRVNGQDDNIGDIVIRRRLLAFAASFGPLHLHVGEASDRFLSQFVPKSAELYRSMRAFHKSALQKAANERVVYFEEPGEFYVHQPLSRLLTEHIHLRTFLMQLRRRGGKSFLLGAGLRHRATITQRAIIQASVSNFDLVRWRDPRSADQIGPKTTMPDWAFGEAALSQGSDRDKLVVSLRSDRLVPSQAWLSGVRLYADTNSLRIVVATQVGRDQQRSDEIASALGGDVTTWLKADMESTELHLLKTYGQARIVLSDRLHVLILGARQGACPLCITEFYEEKVERHFNAIGLEAIAHNVADWTAQDIYERICVQSSRTNEVRSRIADAKTRVEEIESQVINIVAA